MTHHTPADHRRPSTGRRTLAAVAAVAALGPLAGCRDQAADQVVDRGPTTTEEATTSSAEASTTTSTEAGPDLSQASTTPVSVEASRVGSARLIEVRVAHHDGYDRVVFELEGEPGYSVAYAEGEVVSDGSGEVVPVEGDHTIEVRLEVASDGDDQGRSTTGGQKRADAADLAVVTEVVRLSGFEGILAWGIGTTREAPYVVRLFTEGDRTRLVIDVTTD